VTALYDVLKDKTNDATKLFVLGDFDRVLGLSLLEKAAAKREELKKQAVTAGEFTIVSESGESDPEVEAQIQARQDAKKAKNFAEADRIRDALKAAGIEITDIPHGAKWKRI
jgi:cysteinyl-tRNA synthetase